MKKIALFLLVALKTSSMMAALDPETLQARVAELKGPQEIPEFHHRASFIEHCWPAVAPLAIAGAYGIRKFERYNTLCEQQTLLGLGIVSAVALPTLFFSYHQISNVKKKMSLFYQADPFEIKKHLCHVFCGTGAPCNNIIGAGEKSIPYTLKTYELVARRVDDPSLKAIWNSPLPYTNDSGTQLETLPMHAKLLCKEYNTSIFFYGSLAVTACVPLCLFAKAAFNFFKNT